jgi:hypothetical protein
MLIDTINKVRSVFIPNPDRKEKIEPARKDLSDTVIISREGRERVEREKAVGKAREIVVNTPDIREEKVDTAKNRMESGFYNRKEVIDETSKRVVEDIFSSV